MSTDQLLSFTGGFCGAVPGVDHGYVENTTSLLTQGSATYKCFQGFTRNGNSKTPCLDTREWDSRPTCTGEYNVTIFNAQYVHLNIAA